MNQQMKEMAFDQTSAPVQPSPGVAGLAAQDAIDAAREGDLIRACILAGVAAKYSEGYDDLMSAVAVLALNSTQ